MVTVPPVFAAGSEAVAVSVLLDADADEVSEDEELLLELELHPDNTMLKLMIETNNTPNPFFIDKLTSHLC
jgi:hypothetical protein